MENKSLFLKLYVRLYMESMPAITGHEQQLFTPVCTFVYERRRFMESMPAINVPMHALLSENTVV